MNRVLINDIKENEETKISGFIESLRDTRYMVFIILKDISGKIQVSIDKGTQSFLTDKVVSLLPGSVVSFYGKMVLNEKVRLGGKEFLPESVTIESIAEASPIKPDSSIDQRLDYRWIDLRSPEKKLIFEVETTLNQAMRDYCIANGFIEIHPPTLIGASSEGGADFFEVKYFDRKAYLSQSPQFYKQMAMCAGFEKVFINTPVFRAEKSFTKKHATEFSGFDIEFSYIDSEEDVMKMEENILHYAISEVKKKHGDKVKELLGVDIVVPSLPFPRITMREAYSILRDKCGRKINEGDDFSTDDENALTTYMENLTGHQFFFVREYPTDVRAFYTMKKDEDPKYSKSYDLYFKDVEITSGAQREHRPDVLLKQIVAKGIDPKPMESYINFFKNGCPPHGGFGIGLDRVLMLLLDLPTIKEAMFVFRGPNRLNP